MLYRSRNAATTERPRLYLFVVTAGQPSRLARNSHTARSAAAITEDRSEAEERVNV